MNGAILPLPSTPSWRGAQFKKHRDNFTFTFTFTCSVLPHVFTQSRDKNTEIKRSQRTTEVI